jgi:uncharacterized membrane protein YeiB
MTEPREAAFDVARAVAMAGMLVAHYGAAPIANPVGGAIRRSVDGRAMPLFVALGGIGLTLLMRSGTRGVRPVLIRSALLFVAGLVLWQHVPDLAIILQFYAVFLTVGLLLVRVPSRWLPVIAAAVAVLGAATWLRWGTVWASYDGWEGWTTLRSPWPLVTDLFITGAYPFFPTFAFFAFGMWIGRLRLDSARVRWQLIGGGAIAIATGLGAETVRNHTVLRWKVLDAQAHSHMPAWMIAAAGSTAVVIGVCAFVVRARPHLMQPVACTGQLAFTFYVAHGLALRWWPERWLDHLVPDLIVMASVFVGFMLFANLWRRRFRHGPFEALLRFASR